MFPARLIWQSGLYFQVRSLFLGIPPKTDLLFMYELKFLSKDGSLSGLMISLACSLYFLISVEIFFSPSLQGPCFYFCNLLRVPFDVTFCPEPVERRSVVRYDSSPFARTTAGRSKWGFFSFRSRFGGTSTAFQQQESPPPRWKCSRLISMQMVAE